MFFEEELSCDGSCSKCKDTSCINHKDFDGEMLEDEYCDHCCIGCSLYLKCQGEPFDMDSEDIII